MSIRSACPGQFPAIAALLHRAYEPVLSAMSPEHAEHFRQAISGAVSHYGENGTWFISESADQIVGCVAYFRPQSVAHRLFDDSWAHIQLLGVAPDHTRRGHGKALMHHCLLMARSAGAKILALQTSELMAPARQLYESLGFVLERDATPAFGHPTYLYLHRES